MPVGGIIPARSFRTSFLADFRVIRESREIDLVEQQIRRLQFLVVADHAVLVEDGALFGNFRDRGRRAWRRPAVARRRRVAPRCATGRPLWREGPGRHEGH